MPHLTIINGPRPVPRCSYQSRHHLYSKTLRVLYDLDVLFTLFTLLLGTYLCFVLSPWEDGHTFFDLRYHGERIVSRLFFVHDVYVLVAISGFSA